jgi:hypothetical protein
LSAESQSLIDGGEVSAAPIIRLDVFSSKLPLLGVFPQNFPKNLFVTISEAEGDILVSLCPLRFSSLAILGAF